MKDKKTDRSRTKDGAGLAVRSADGLMSVFDDFKPFDKLFQPFFQLGRLPEMRTDSFRQPLIDFQDRGDHYSLTAELPGFTKDEVEVRVDSQGMELRAQKTERKTNDNEGSYQASSRSYYEYVALPDQVVAEKIDGTMKNGILELKLPKRASKQVASGRRVDLK